MSDRMTIEELKVQIQAVASAAIDLVSVLGKEGYALHAIIAGFGQAISVTTASLVAVGMPEDVGRNAILDLQIPMLEAYEKVLLNTDKLKLILQKPEGSA